MRSSAVCCVASLGLCCCWWRWFVGLHVTACNLQLSAARAPGPHCLQVLLVPSGTLQQASAHQPMAAPIWPLLESAAIKSLAPIQDMVVVAGAAQGSDDPYIVASCGVAPAGRLARIRMAFGLRPYMADGPEVPVSAQSNVGRRVAAHGFQPPTMHRHLTCD